MVATSAAAHSAPPLCAAGFEGGAQYIAHKVAAISMFSAPAPAPLLPANILGGPLPRPVSAKAQAEPEFKQAVQTLLKVGVWVCCLPVWVCCQCCLPVQCGCWPVPGME